MVQSNYNLLMNPTISTQQGMNENSEMQDLFLEDELNGIFDDDAAPEDFNVENDEGSLDLNEDSEHSHESRGNDGDGSDDQNDRSHDGETRTSSGGGGTGVQNVPSRKSSSSKEGGRRRRSNHIEGDSKGVTPPSWHSEAADKQHRQAMILEIARLLQARKKATPSQEWLHQLPHKARKLEGRLYRSATSLEAYLDRSTLKNRLRKLARAIMRQYNDGKRPKSFSSLSIARSSFRSSASDASSLQQVLARNAANFSNLTSLTSRSLGANNVRPSVISINSNNNVDAEISDSGSKGGKSLSRDSRSASEGMIGRPSSSGPSTQATSMMPLGRSTSEMSPNQSNSGPQQRSQSAPVVDVNSPSAGSVNSKNNNNSSSINNMMQDGNGMDDGMTELERQKAVNAKLQQQIMENIRRQEDLVRRLQEKEQQQLGLGDNSNSNNGQQNMQLNGMNANNSSLCMSPSMNAMSMQAGNNNNSLGANMNSFLNSGQMAPNNMMMAQASMLNNQMNQQQQNQNNLVSGNNQGMMNNGGSNNNLQGQGQGMGSQMSQMSNSNNPFLNFQSMMAAQGLSGSNSNSQHGGPGIQHMSGLQQQQLQMLRGNMPMLGSNSNMMSSMQGLQQQGNGMIQSMLSPNLNGQSSMQSNTFDANQQIGGPNAANNGGAPLSPGSFNW